MPSHAHDDRSAHYAKSSLTLVGAVSMGTGVMIGAGIFALTGQMAELARGWFPLAFVCSAIVAGFSAYSYIKMSQVWPSAGGIAMFLEKAYGRSMMTGASALLMYFSMVINESLVARTFGTYTLQLFDVGRDSFLVPILGISLLAAAFLVNILSNRFIQTFAFIMAFLKVAGLVALAGGGLWAAGFSLDSLTGPAPAEQEQGWINFLGAVALGILAYKGFTTITNSGGEIEHPHKNVGRAIAVSIALCAVIYLLVAVAVASNLTLEEIVGARDYSLAEAARPAFGQAGLLVTVGFAIIATVSGVIASVFAVSRMLAMLTDMKLVPHSHFGMPGTIQRHTLVYTIILAMVLTLLFDLGRIASLGAVFYLVMDIVVHWGVLRYLREETSARSWVLITAITLDVIVLAAFLWVKAQSDMLIVWMSIIGFITVFAGERWFLRLHQPAPDSAGVIQRT